MKKLPFEVHPAANIFPMIKGTAFKELVDDIRENGINEPVVFWKGKLLDGRNRSMACLEIGIDPLDHAIDIDPETDPVAFVLSANLYRRHLNETERESVATKVAGLSKGDNQHTKQDGANALSTKNAAELLSVSEDGVKRNKAARKGGCKELAESLDAGEIPSSTAANFVKAVPDKKEQAKILEQGLPAVRQAIKESKADQSRPSTKVATPKAKEPETERRPAKTERQFFVELRKLFDEMDDFHKQRSVEMWTDWLLEGAAQ
jgi:ParB-like chromosome segregation protein Spo0J